MHASNLQQASPLPAYRPTYRPTATALALSLHTLTVCAPTHTPLPARLPVPYELWCMQQGKAEFYSLPVENWAQPRQ
jgi:hypothetical protein